MKTTAVRLYGIDDLRLETFDLPQMKEDEILVKVSFSHQAENVNTLFELQCTLQVLRFTNGEYSKKHSCFIM